VGDGGGRSAVSLLAAIDTDGDGYPDSLELSMGQDPNTFCATMRGDVDQDGTVTLLDLSQIAADFLLPVPPANPLNDQDGDNVVPLLGFEKVFTISVTDVNDAPLASAQSTNTNEDTQKTITLGGSDADDNNLTFSIVLAPAHGTLGAIGTPDCTAVNNCTAN